jgi:beta-1,2-rhamnosyltransferase WsaF-like protein
VTTSWWTTWAIKQALGVDRIVYLLQEDERMFYPFGDERLLCEEVLATDGLKFLVNAKLLFDHLAATGVNVLGNGTWFEPAFPASTFYYTERANAQKFNFLFYARPNNLRNLFYRGIEAIEQAIRRGILDPDLWNFHFVGKDLDKLILSGGIRPTLHNNLPWADYANLVRNTDVGLSLMYSPHPSYPPLDLAASGAVAVTNRYGQKQSLDAYSRNIVCADIGVDSLVQGIAEAVQLVRTPARRLQNYTDNGLLRSWETSFAGAFDFVSRGVLACS